MYIFQSNTCWDSYDSKVRRMSFSSACKLSFICVLQITCRLILFRITNIKLQENLFMRFLRQQCTQLPLPPQKKISRTFTKLTYFVKQKTRTLQLITVMLRLCHISFFHHGAIARSGAGPPHYLGFKIRIRNTTLERTPLDE